MFVHASPCHIVRAVSADDHGATDHRCREPIVSGGIHSDTQHRHSQWSTLDLVEDLSSPPFCCKHMLFSARPSLTATDFWRWQCTCSMYRRKQQPKAASFRHATKIQSGFHCEEPHKEEL